MIITVNSNNNDIKKLIDDGQPIWKENHDTKVESNNYGSIKQFKNVENDIICFVVLKHVLN